MGGAVWNCSFLPKNRLPPKKKANLVQCSWHTIYYSQRVRLLLAGGCKSPLRPSGSKIRARDLSQLIDMSIHIRRTLNSYYKLNKYQFKLTEIVAVVDYSNGCFWRCQHLHHCRQLWVGTTLWPNNYLFVLHTCEKRNRCDLKECARAYQTNVYFVNKIAFNCANN